MWWIDSGLFQIQISADTPYVVLLPACCLYHLLCIPGPVSFCCESDLKSLNFTLYTMHMAQWSSQLSCADSPYFVYKIKLPIPYNNLYRIIQNYFHHVYNLAARLLCLSGRSPEAYSSLFICVCVCFIPSITSIPSSSLKN